MVLCLRRRVVIIMTVAKAVSQQYLIHIEDLNLASGSASFKKPFGVVYGIFVTQTGTTAVAESFTAYESGDDILVKSSSGTSTAGVRVLVIGRF